MKKDNFSVQFNALRLQEEIEEETIEEQEGIEEQSATGGGTTGGAAFTPGTGEQYATPKAFKKKKKVNEVKRPNDGYFPVKGFKKGETKDNGGFQYKEMWEQQEVEENLTKDEFQKAQSLLDKIKEKNPKIYNAILSLIIDPYTNYSDIDRLATQSVNENYSRFKNETKTRGRADQFHQAIKEVRKKVQEINKVFEYVNMLKNELNEGENGLKYKKHTEAAIGKIKEMVSELNAKVKKFK